MLLIIILFLLTCLFAQQFYWANHMTNKTFEKAEKIFNNDATSHRDRQLIEMQLTAYQTYAINCIFIGSFVGTLFLIMLYYHLF